MYKRESGAGAEPEPAEVGAAQPCYVLGLRKTFFDD
jgi:hypothetical protein